jgi:hypothetical protein
MLVEMGNVAPASDAAGPAVCRMTIYGTYVVADKGARMTIGHGNEVVVESAADLAAHAAAHLGRAVGVTHLPEQEALLNVRALWMDESQAPPSWVWSDDENFAVLLGEFFGCPVGRPDDVEMTHHTVNGPPGVRGRDAEADAAISTANEPTEGEG